MTWFLLRFAAILALGLGAPWATADASAAASLDTAQGAGRRPSYEQVLPTGPRPRQYEPMTAERLGIFSGNFAAACGFPFLQHSSGGRYLVAASDIWRETTAARTSLRLIIVDLDCRSRGDGQCAFILDALGGLRLVSWSGDERRFYVIEDDSTLVEITVGFGMEVPARTTGRVALPRPVAISIASTDRTPSSSVDEEARRLTGAYREASAWARPDQSIMGLYLNGARTAALLEGDASLDVEAVVAGARFATGLPAPLIRHAQLSDLGEPAALLSDRGVRARLGAGRPDERARSYERAIVSTADGRTLGYLGPEGFVAEGGQSSARRGGAAINSRLTRAGGELIGGSVAGDGGAAAVLRRLDGTVTIEATRHGRHRIVRCPEASGAALASLRRIDLGVPGRKLDAIHAVPAGPSRGLAVYFSGGPASGVLSAADDYVARSFLAQGYAVLAVNYSGTSLGGLGLLDRLRAEGVAALREDARVVARSLRALPANGELIVAGASFGALPALALDAELGAAAHRLVLLTPYLAHREPAAWVARPALARYQRSFEARTLGIADAASRTRFQTDMDALQRARSGAPAFLAFGTADTVSRQQDLLFRPGPGDRVVTVAATHGLAPAAPETWSQMRAWLAE